jgi:predicted transcriptional regulator
MRDEIREILERLRPAPAKKQVEAARGRFAELLKRRNELQDALDKFRGSEESAKSEDVALGYIYRLVLAAVYFLRGEGSAVEIARKVDELGSNAFEPSAILISLKRLERQGLISSHRVETAPPKSGDVFTVTPEGERMLKKVRAAAQRLMDALDGLDS